MVRRSKKQPDALQVLNELIQVLPWWGGPIVAVVVHILVRWAVPAIVVAVAPDDPTMNNVLTGFVGRFAPFAAWMLTALLLIMWLASLVQKRLDQSRLDVQTGIQSVANLNWREFERLLAEAFRRQGYQVELAGGAGPDGGVDIRLRRGGGVILVQCKQYRVRQVGVKVVRELLGAVTKERAQGGILVTSGDFTRDAVACAEGTSIDLMDGERLGQMIRAVQNPARPQDAPEVAASAQEVRAAPACPMCGSQMLLRSASRGARVGSQFWGCSEYPRCRGTRPVVT